MNKVASHVIVRGKVQGVYFRASTQEEAAKLGLSGWVKNRPDGAVEIHAEGEKHKVETLIAWCHEGPPSAAVQDVTVAWISPEGFKSFEVLRA